MHGEVHCEGQMLAALKDYAVDRPIGHAHKSVMPLKVGPIVKCYVGIRKVTLVASNVYPSLRSVGPCPC